MAARMRRQLNRTFLTQPVAIERPTTAGTWSPVATVKASVQHIREDRSDAAPADATGLESRALRIYLAHDVDTDVGHRLQWDGQWWHIARCTPKRGEDVYRRVEAERPQMGTQPLEVTFYRRINQANEAVGTFTVLHAIDQQSPLDTGQASQFDAATAAGAMVTGTMTGGGSMSVVQPGDWFSIGTMPGRVTTVDTSYADHTTLRYRMEQRGMS